MRLGSGCSEESEEEEDDDDDDESEDNEAQIKQESDQATRQRRDDIDEGKTVFVKNLPFSATNEEFKNCIEQFGPVFYAVICKDKLTEHSRGSGFVKFKVGFFFSLEKLQIYVKSLISLVEEYS